MSYTFAAIIDQEVVDETWVPRIVDKQGSVKWHEEDGRVEHFSASGLTIYRGKVDSSGKLLAIEKVDIAVHVSRARLVMVCRRFDKGGGWIGSPGMMLMANTASKARARVRSHGKFLVGQLRWPWLSDVGYSEKTGWLSSNQLRVVVQDGESGQWLYIDFELRKRDDPRGEAEQIVRAAVAARKTYDYLGDDDRAALEDLKLPPYDPASKRFATVRIPVARKALAQTACPAPARLEPPHPEQAYELEAPAVRPARAEMLAPRTPATVAAGMTPAAPEPARAPAPVETPAAAAAPAPVAEAESPAAERPRCGGCGHPLYPGARFCRGCGLPLAEPPAPPTPPEPEACPKCEAPLPPRARFCRTCGHLLIADTPELATLPLAPAASACPQCAAPVSPDARFCRSCGQSLVAEGGAPTSEMPRGVANDDGSTIPPATSAWLDSEPRPAAAAVWHDDGPPTKPATWRRRRWPLLAAAAAIVAGASVAAVLVAPWSNDDKSTDRAARLSTATPAPTTSTDRVETPEPTLEATETPEPLAAGSLVAGRYARLGSFRTQARAQEEADSLQAQGVPAHAMSSNEGAGMMPAFWVVVAGPLDTLAEERSVRRTAKKAGIRDAFVDQLEPATSRLRPVDLAGDFRGDVRQTNATVKRLNKTISTTFSFSADGQSGTVIYDKPACTGALTLAGRKGAVATFDETITDGKCSDGGRWHVRLEGDELLATWWRENDLTFVLGRLSP